MSPRSFGVSAVSVCFVIFGFLNTLAYLNYLTSIRLPGGLAFDRYYHLIERYLSYLSNTPMNPHTALSMDSFRQLPELKILQSFVNDLVMSDSFGWMMDATLFLSVSLVIVGFGLWKLRPWARWAAVGLHLAMIPLHISMVQWVSKDAWEKLNQYFPQLRLPEFDAFKTPVLMPVYLVIALMYLAVAGYFFIPKVKNQFTGVPHVG